MIGIKKSRNLMAVIVAVMLTVNFVSAVEQSATASEYQVKTTLPILSEQKHTSCQLTAGFNLTMIHCADEFEVYDT